MRVTICHLYSELPYKELVVKKGGIIDSGEYCIKLVFLAAGNNC